MLATYLYEYGYKRMGSPKIIIIEGKQNMGELIIILVAMASFIAASNIN